MDPFVRISSNPTYRSWKAMRRRCNDQANTSYGGRGITYPLEWEDFTCFVSDLGPRRVGTTLERIDNEASYSRQNCRWATSKEQADNRRSSRKLTIDGVTRSVTDWSRLHGISDQTVFYRLNKGEEALSALTREPSRTFRGNQYTQ